MAPLRFRIVAVAAIAGLVITGCRETDPVPSSIRDVFTGVAGSWLDLSGDPAPSIHASVDPAELDLYGLIGPAAVVDLTGRSGSEVPVQVTDLQVWEARHGTLPDRAFLVVHTGTEEGADAPGLAPDAARWLVEERRPGAVGIDGAVEGSDEAYRILVDGGVPVLEGLSGVERLPEWGGFVVALPPPGGGIGGIEGERRSAPVRVVAFLPTVAEEP